MIGRCARGTLLVALALGLVAGVSACRDGGSESAATTTTAAGTTPDAVEPVVVPAPSAEREWAPADTATIRPGVQIHTDGAQCTANFIFAAGDDLLIGQAAHCSSEGSPFDINGCHTDSLPLGTEVRIDGAERPGTMVYNSWLAMQAADESDPETCRFNDLALIRIHPSDHAEVNPSVPVFGGPTGLNTDGVPTGQPVVSFGNSLIRLGIAALNLNQGISVAGRGEGWTHEVLTLTPGIPGDSGSAFLDPRGRALGLLSTGDFTTSDLTDLGKALAYANANGDLDGDVALATGTEDFTSSGGAPPLAGAEAAE